MTLLEHVIAFRDNKSSELGPWLPLPWTSTFHDVGGYIIKTEESEIRGRSVTSLERKFSLFLDSQYS